jgi:hypothetical protein
MTYKLYVSGNYLYLHDLTYGTSWEGGKSTFEIVKKNSNNFEYQVYHHKKLIATIDPVNTLDQNDVPYTEAGFLVWKEGNSAFNNGSGSGAPIVVEYYADLPAPASAVNKFYWVEKSSGYSWLPWWLGGDYHPKGLYYSNGVIWATAIDPYTPMIGDVKQSMTNIDQYGWVKLDGRATSSLTTSQQVQAANLGFGANIPNASNAVPLQNGGVLGAVSGDMLITIAQANLPNITLNSNNTGSHAHIINVGGNHSHEITYFRSNGSAVQAQPGRSTDNDQPLDLPTTGSGAHDHNMQASGNHQHTVPLGGSGTAIDITPRALSVNNFVFLGY